MTERNPTPPQLSHLDAICRPQPAAYFVPLHPYMFRCGQSALIVGVVVANGRPCFRLRYADGVEDSAPIEDEDFAGKGGLGVFYEIRGEL